MKNESIVDPCAAGTWETDTSTANAAAVITIAAGADDFWVLDAIGFSYSAGSPAGSITVAIGGTTLFTLNITGTTDQFLDFSNCPIYKAARTKNEALVVTLAAGGASVIGKLNIRYR